MDVTPTTPKPRPTPAKSSAVKTVAPANSAGKSPKSRRRQAAAAVPEIVVASLPEVILEAPADMNQRIATTAYFLAQARNFEPGHELADWLEAERQVRAD